MADLVCTFLTHNRDRPLTFGVAVDARHGGGDPTSTPLPGLAALANRNPGACAYGKIVVLGPNGIFTFQADNQGNAAAVFCGNSTAAAIGLLSGRGEVRSRVSGLAAKPYDLTAQVDGDTITQQWTIPFEPVKERMWKGRRALFLSTLNDYVILLGSLPADINAEDARRELIGSASPGKLAVIEDKGPEPLVEFYNSNGRHGALPQTGLATIALAASAMPSLRSFFPDEQLRYRTAEGLAKARLPAIRNADEGRVAIEMPAVSVTLKRLSLDMAA